MTRADRVYMSGQCTQLAGSEALDSCPLIRAALIGRAGEHLKLASKLPA